VTALLSDLLERGLDPEQGMLFVIDGSKALRKAVRDVFGEAPVQRCIRHKERNVLEHLPERDRAAVKRRLRQAWALEDHDHAIDRLHTLAVELERSHPGASGSLREGLAETRTVAHRGITGSLKCTLASTNPCVECVRRTTRNVKRWQSGEMALRWTAAGMLEAERQFRRIIGLPRPRQAHGGDRTRPGSHHPRRVPGRGGRRGPEAGARGSFRSGDVGGGDRGV
jgi:putative transposase